jgi:PHD-zinc-finger like domain
MSRARCERCCVCLGANISGHGLFNEAGTLLKCSADCGTLVHKTCLLFEPRPVSVQWTCHKCLAGPLAKSNGCLFCPTIEGAFEKSPTGALVHVCCAQVFGDKFAVVTPDHPLVSNGYYNEKLSDQQRPCMMCRPNKSRLGLTTNCRAMGCKYWFHVTCGLRVAKSWADLVGASFNFCGLHNLCGLHQKLKCVGKQGPQNPGPQNLYNDAKPLVVTLHTNQGQVLSSTSPQQFVSPEDELKRQKTEEAEGKKKWESILWENTRLKHLADTRLDEIERLQGINARLGTVIENKVQTLNRLELENVKLLGDIERQAASSRLDMERNRKLREQLEEHKLLLVDSNPHRKRKMLELPTTRDIPLNGVQVYLTSRDPRLQMRASKGGQTLPE